MDGEGGRSLNKYEKGPNYSEDSQIVVRRKLHGWPFLGRKLSHQRELIDLQKRVRFGQSSFVNIHIGIYLGVASSYCHCRLLATRYACRPTS